MFIEIFQPACLPPNTFYRSRLIRFHPSPWRSKRPRKGDIKRNTLIYYLKMRFAQNGNMFESLLTQTSDTGHLSLEGEASTNLVGSLVQVLSVEGSTEAKSDTRAEENVVSQSSNAAVVDLGLDIVKKTQVSSGIII